MVEGFKGFRVYGFSVLGIFFVFRALGLVFRFQGTGQRWLLRVVSPGAVIHEHILCACILFGDTISCRFFVITRASCLCKGSSSWLWALIYLFFCA